MNLSFNEVEAQVKKAAKGAGYTWGEATEAGKAARWLHMHDVDGCSHFARVLRSDLSSRGLTSCPIQNGILLSDRARKLGNEPMIFSEIREPVILSAFAANAAVLLETPILVQTNAWHIVLDETSAEISGSLNALVDDVVITLHSERPKRKPKATRCFPDPQDWVALSEFAHRTYAPDTEESRRLGAGAGLSDND